MPQFLRRSPLQFRTSNEKAFPRLLSVGLFDRTRGRCGAPLSIFLLLHLVFSLDLAVLLCLRLRPV
ncbi:hypothetical protein A2U01_0100413, partial [Trifolium medium]|nr:hypothetical protein [Trifolium medium]